MASPINCLSRDVYKDGRIIKAARLLGMAVENYFRLCFEIGGNSVTTGSFPNIIRAKLDNLGYRELLVNEALRTPVSVFVCVCLHVSVCACV